jgi:proteasome lid subunit RPN8/RPN11
MLGWLVRLFTWEKREPRVERPAAAPTGLEYITLADGVAHTLRDDYAEHRQSDRGHEEIGWILLGIRQGNEAIALAALPAGADRDAGATHVQFNAEAQVLASRILRQGDKRLQMIGVVHTHPGSMRTPSDGDWEGDSRWVAQLRGGEGVFAIGTADARAEEAAPHLQVFTDTCFSWYALSASDRVYRPLPLRITAGLDLAQPLRSVWDAIETHSAPLNRLCRQLARVQFEIVDEDEQIVLCVKIGLTEKNQQLRLLLSEMEARYYWEREGELIAIDPHETQPDRAVYLILAELAKEAAPRGWETRTYVES